MKPLEPTPEPGVVQVRCSRLPLFFECPSSAQATAVRYDPSGDAAVLGTAAHAAMALVVLGQEVDLAAIAHEHEVDEDELGRLVAYGRQAWAELRPHLPAPRVEQRVDSNVTGGSADVLHADTDSLVVVDWKSGWVRRHHRHQLTGYAHAARAQYGMPTSGHVTVATVWLRFGEIEVDRLDDDKLDAWEREYEALTAEIGSTYNPGPHCAFCPAQLTCEARSAFLRGATAALASAQRAGAMTPEDMARLVPQASMLRRALDLFDSALREHVRAAGRLPLGDGTALALESRRRREIRARAAWPVLTADLGLSEDDLDRVLSVSKGALEEVVGERAAPRMKGKDRAAAMQKLCEAGAVIERPYQQLSVIPEEGESR